MSDIEFGFFIVAGATIVISIAVWATNKYWDGPE